VAETPVPPFLPSGALQPGHVLAGRYALTTLLARGGMADVWQARDMVLERQVAVKVLHPHLAADAHFVDRFRSEAVAAARLHHPSIVAIFDTCSDNGVEAIVMELVHGHTLREELDTHGPMDPRIAADFGADLATALEAAHRAGLVHRDVKPANILLCEDQRVMITDFGIAKIRDEADRTQTGTMLGSVKYLSPEQVDGQPVDGRTDVYSLGVVLYETLTGRVPFLADTPAATALARLHNVPTRPRQLRPAIPPALDDVIMKALAREPDDRFASSADFATALLATRIAPLHVDPDITEVAPRPTPDRAVAPAAATAVLGATVGAATAAGPAPGAPGAPGALPGAHPEQREIDFGPSRSRRRWGLAILALLIVAVALGVATVLVMRTDRGKQIAGQVTTGTSPPPSGGALKITSVASFDPEGDKDEVEGQVAAITDGNPATSWHTEYYTNRTFSHASGGPGKTGVGFSLGVAAPTELGTLTVESPTQDWSAQVYVADKPGATLADWGSPVDQKTNINGNATFDLKGTKGSYVLVWITDLGSGPAAPTGPPNVYVQVSDAPLQGA
jgi:serine/threonine-protein kinase